MIIPVPFDRIKEYGSPKVKKVEEKLKKLPLFAEKRIEIAIIALGGLA